jgi:hypothetical protein
VPGILADSGAIDVHFRLSGLDLSALMLAPCLLGCAGTGWQEPLFSGSLLHMSATYLRWYCHEGAGSSKELSN